MTGGALAASLLMMMLFSQTNPAERPENDERTTATSIVPQKSVPQVQAVEVQLRSYPSNAPLLVMRNHALRMDFDEYSSDASLDDSPPVVEVTYGQLLRELLPDLGTSDSPSSERRPFWSRWILGETT